MNTVAEDQLAVFHRGGEITARLVDVGDDDGARHSDVGALLPQHPGGTVDGRGRRGGVRRGDDEQRGIRGPQTGPQFTDEIGMPGGVHQIEPDRTGPAAPARHRRPAAQAPAAATALVDHGAGHRERHRSTDPPFDILEIADGGAVLDAARPADGAGRGQDRLDQHGLPGAAGADENHVANLFGGSVPGRLAVDRRHAERPARIGESGTLTESARLVAHRFGELQDASSSSPLPRPQRPPRTGAAAVSAGSEKPLCRQSADAGLVAQQGGADCSAVASGDARLSAGTPTPAATAPRGRSAVRSGQVGHQVMLRPSRCRGGQADQPTAPLEHRLPKGQPDDSGDGQGAAVPNQ